MRLARLSEKGNFTIQFTQPTIFNSESLGNLSLTEIFDVHIEGLDSVDYNPQIVVSSIGETEI